MFKKILIALLIVFVVLQLIPRPAKNVQLELLQSDISKTLDVPADVQQIFKISCNDCHSNNTIYPWYSRIQPTAWWLGKHIADGKKHLNFSEFGSYRLAKQYHKLEEVKEMVEENEMPLSSYTLVHSDAALSADEKNKLVAWVNTSLAAMKARYPADSLVMKKRQ